LIAVEVDNASMSLRLTKRDVTLPVLIKQPRVFNGWRLLDRETERQIRMVSGDEAWLELMTPHDPPDSGEWTDWIPCSELGLARRALNYGPLAETKRQLEDARRPYHS
jgi:hypothetical protein